MGPPTVLDHAVPDDEVLGRVLYPDPVAAGGVDQQVLDDVRIVRGSGARADAVAWGEGIIAVDEDRRVAGRSCRWGRYKR